MKVLLTGGGTGGHIYPALGLAERFLARGDEVLYIGLRGGLEERLVPGAHVWLQTICAAPWQRRISAELVQTLTANVAGLREAQRILRAFSPQVVIATGGYVSFPVIAAAWLAQCTRPKAQRALLALVEPNAVAGLTNRALAPLVDAIWGSFPESAGCFARRFVRTGTPVRLAYLHPPSKADARQALGLDPLRRTILVIGGSQGARSINTALAELCTQPLPSNWQILHITGHGGYEAACQTAQAAIARGEVHIFAYLDDPLAAYAAADLVIARAGASTLAELAALGKPALLVPYPHATADHQRKNALAFIANGAGHMLEDADCCGVRLRLMLQTSLEPLHLHALTAAAQKLATEDAGVAILRQVDNAIQQKTTLRNGV